MNSKVKAGIAVAILTALAALIILDRQTAPNSKPNGNPQEVGQPPTFKAPIIKRESGATIVVEKTPTTPDPFGDLYPGSGKPSPKPELKPELKPEPKPFKGLEKPATAMTKYTIQEGDSYETIAEHFYGKRSLWSIIAKANPEMRADRLRIRKTIMIPEKPRTTSVTPSTNFGILDTPGTYTVKPGDTLSEISVKVFKTSRHWRAILKENRSSIEDPNWLVVGTKLTMPNVPKATPSSNVSPARGTGTTSVSSNGKTHKVQNNESLWKIAAKYRKTRSITEMISAIVRANTKVKNTGTMLQVGWNLVIPN